MPENPSIHPRHSDELAHSVAEKVTNTSSVLQQAVGEFKAICFASSLGAEDMVLTDLIATHNLPIEIFSLDTGRLPEETYTLMAEIQQHYGLTIKTYFPQHDAVEKFIQQHGINAFYQSASLRKACCQMRKVEPLGRALSGQSAWITGMRAQQAATRQGLAVREFDSTHGLEKFNPLADWKENEVWYYIHKNQVPYNQLHESFYPSIGCAPCTRAISPGEDVRAGRWWWENPESKECGLHVK